MKTLSLFFSLLLISSACHSQETVSQKQFEKITLVNNIEFNDSDFNQPRFSCAFLIKHQEDTFAVTAKHILKIIKPDGMKAVSLEKHVKSWSLYPLEKQNDIVSLGKLLNENKKESLAAKSTYNQDWLVFSLKENNSQVKPLEIRTTPLTAGEKLYVIGWTRKMETGPQRVYEFEYFKTVGNRLLLKEIIVPEQFGGLSGAPLVDANGLVVGMVSNGTVDPSSKVKYFSPCSLTELIPFLEKYQQTKQ